MRRLATVVLLLLAVCLPARAAAQGAAEARGGAGAFEGRTLEVTGLFLAEAWDFNGRPGAALAGVNVAIGLPIHGGWAAVVEGLGMDVDERRRNTPVGGISIMLRRRLISRGATTAFAEVGAGVSYAAQEVPAHGTRFNYPLQVGVGLAHRFGPHFGGLASLRLFHLSNKNLDGSWHNPDIEALGGHVGVFIDF